VSSRKESPIALADVTVRYGQASEHALSNVTLDVGAGEIVAILGPNGAGKSTLLRVMTGSLTPTSGSATLFGQPLGSLDRQGIARRVAFVAQATDVAFGFTVHDVVMMGRAPHQGGWMRPSPADERAVKDALARCELEGLSARRIDTLSGGEQKRVAIARALAQAPDVLLLDEPGAFLDVRHQLALYDMLVELAGAGMAIALTMHDINAAAQYAARIVLLKGGVTVAIGSVDEVLTYRRLHETFDADLYCGVNDVTGARFFLPMRKKALTARS
jgi:iron complex transport system ATP-binding protein